jgi:putative DNA primase/helicase
VSADHIRNTDVGNAKRLVRAHRDILRYVPQWDRWLMWDGTRWRPDTTNAIVELAKKVVDGMWDEARDLGSDGSASLRKWATDSESAHHIRSMITLARSERGIPVEPHQLDANPMLLNVFNGTVDLTTGTLRAPNPADLITKMAAVAMDPNATCPRWTSFLERVLPDPEVRACVQRDVGYGMTGDVSEQVLFFNYGGGANGKSTLFETMIAMLGDYAMTAAPDLLLVTKEVHPTGIADLHGARLVVSTEVEQNRRLNEALVKQLTGGDRIKARYMRQDFFEFDPTHKLFLYANHKPVIRGTDHAIWRRIQLIPFTVTIPEADKDRHLPARLGREVPGILNWALAGCLDWQKKGLAPPPAVTNATSDYRAEMDVMGGWIDDSCISIEVAVAGATELYNNYTKWCHDNGEQPITQRTFGLSLGERGYTKEKHYGPQRRTHWFGIGLIEPGPEPEPLQPTQPDFGMNAHTRAYSDEQE